MELIKVYSSRRRGIINRNQTNGKYGIWGHDIGDLDLSAVIVKKTGDGLIDKTWTDAWAYYFGASYNVNATNRLELYALGAPQRHGQNLYQQNAAAYDHDYARDELGYSQAALEPVPKTAADGDPPAARPNDRQGPNRPHPWQCRKRSASVLIL